jgi:hypothetical protein
VVQGHVSISRQGPQGDELILALCEPGEYFGELALFDQAPRSASAVALDDCAVLLLSRAVFQRFLQAHPTALWTCLGVVVAQLRRLTEVADEMALLDVRQRLARRLLLRGAFATAGSDAENLAIDDGFHSERAVMRWTRDAGCVVDRRDSFALLNQFLESALIVCLLSGADDLLGILAQQRPQEPARAAYAAIEIDRGDHRLEGAGKDAIADLTVGGGLASAEIQGLIQPELPSPVRERLGPHERGPVRGQGSLRNFGVPFEEELGGNHAQHRIAEKL